MDISEYRAIQKILTDKKIEFFAIQPKTERPKKVLLKGIPKHFTILQVENSLTKLGYDIHRVSQLKNYRIKEFHLFPCRRNAYREFQDIMLYLLSLML